MGEKSVLITGSSGLVGSQCVRHFDRLGWRVHGIDNNMRIVFLGVDGDAAPVLHRLARSCRSFHGYDVDLRFREGVLQVVRDIRPNLIVHCAAQSAQEISKDRPFEDFDINAGGTLNLLEACRRFCPESPFVFLSSNRVYGDAPNHVALRELETRWEYASELQRHGIDESYRMDGALHTLYGVSKAAADLLVQEYGRYFGLPTTCLRISSVTGPQELGTEPHGFLAYLAKCFHEGRTYRIFGGKGKQVRDILHVQDLCEAIQQVYAKPRVAAVYNLGAGRANSVSIVEAIAAFGEIFGENLHTEYVDESRKGDYICYITDTRKFRRDYPGWEVRVPLAEIMKQSLAPAVRAAAG